MATRIFHTEGITKVYRTGEVEVWALRGVEAELYMGEFTVLLGASTLGNFALHRPLAARRGWAMWTCVAGNLGLLGTFRYLGFFAKQTEALLAAAQDANLSVPECE